MKTITYLIFILMLSLSGCSSQKNMVKKPPIALGQATCQSWTGGRSETGSGMLLEIPIDTENAPSTTFQKAFFRGKIAEVKMENTDNGWVAKANFINRTMEKPDLVMHKDSRQEVGNKPPQFKEEFPFELESDQCVLSFVDGETVKYFKIEGVKEKKMKMFK